MKILLYWIQRYILAMCSLMLLPLTLPAAELELPNVIPGTTTVSAEELIKLAGKIESLLLIDARLSVDHTQGAIEGSISLPDTMTSCNALGKFTTDEHHPILFYCNGPKCERSANAVQIARECGYQNVYWFRGGLEEWKKKNYPFIRR